MVEKFNKTLAKMLTAYLSDIIITGINNCNMPSWQITLLFPKTPYKLKLGREVSTPLDQVYELPSDMKASNVHGHFVKKKLEEAYRYTPDKKSIDAETNKYVVGNHFTMSYEVLVFFLRRKIRKSTKLTNFWYSSFVIEEKHTDTTYKIRKKDSKNTIIVHVERLRPYGTQVLNNETEQLNENKNCAKDENLNDEVEDDKIKTDLLGNSEFSVF